MRHHRRTPSRPSVPSTILLGLLLAGLPVLAGCAGIENIVERPTVRLTDAEVTGVSLLGADLVFEFEVDNPNAVGLSLAGFGYDLSINGEPFLDGDRAERLRLDPQSGTTVELPLRVRFADLFRAYDSLRGKDVSSYQLDAEFRFDVPVLGIVRVPVTERGSIPLTAAGWRRSAVE